MRCHDVGPRAKAQVCVRYRADPLRRSPSRPLEDPIEDVGDGEIDERFDSPEDLEKAR